MLNWGNFLFSFPLSVKEKQGILLLDVFEVFM